MTQWKISLRCAKRGLTLPLILILAIVTSTYAEKSLPAVNVSISNGPHGSYFLEGSFSVLASSNAAWEVLTDYDEMSTFVSSIQSSRTLHQDKERLVIEQVMKGQAGFFRKRVHVTLEVREKPWEIVFKDTSNKSFKTYAGSWKVLTTGNQTNVTYKLTATPAFFSPGFLTVSAFKNNVRALLEEVRDEIATRATRQDL